MGRFGAKIELSENSSWEGYKIRLTDFDEKTRGTQIGMN